MRHDVICAVYKYTFIHSFIYFLRVLLTWNYVFTITAEIHARSLVNFYRQYADRHMNLTFTWRVSARERAIRPFLIAKNKLMSVFNESVLLLTMNFVITLSIRRLLWQCAVNPVNPVNPQTTLTMWWRNLWSITGQTHKKLTSIC